MESGSLAKPAGATALLLVPLALLDQRMRIAGGPGIIPFELAGPERSDAILDAWGPDGQRAARASLLLDFPFLVAYTVLNVRIAARSRAALSGSGVRGLGSIGRSVALVQVAAGACDAVENAALLGVIRRAGDARLAACARTAAVTKFVGLIAGWLYLAAALLARSRAGG